jgi:hypothetical protein
MPTVDEAIEQIRAGNREEGRHMLEEILEQDETNEDVWLWLSSVVDTDEDREICLENVLALNPDNEVAQKGLELLQSGTFNVNELLGEDFEVEDKDQDGQATFIEDFIVADDLDEEGFELEFTGSEPKNKRGLNVKVLVLAVLVILVVAVFIGLGAAYFFLLAGDGDSTPVDSPSGQETPVEAPGPAVAPTETPTPLPTEMATATFTPVLQLPTAAPTITPSPIATTVVSPTPSDQ